MAGETCVRHNTPFKRFAFASRFCSPGCLGQASSAMHDRGAVSAAQERHPRSRCSCRSPPHQTPCNPQSNSVLSHDHTMPHAQRLVFRQRSLHLRATEERIPRPPRGSMGQGNSVTRGSSPASSAAGVADGIDESLRSRDILDHREEEGGGQGHGRSDEEEWAGTRGTTTSFGEGERERANRNKQEGRKWMNCSRQSRTGCLWRPVRGCPVYHPLVEDRKCWHACKPANNNGGKTVPPFLVKPVCPNGKGLTASWMMPS